MEKSTLNEVKAILKSLVLSCPEKITIDRLNHDYRDVEGVFIPYRQFGYGNLEQFLKSIPDTLRVFGTGPLAMVCFVGNEKSDHIHDMIMRQKKPKKAVSKSKGLGRKNYNSRHNNSIQQDPFKKSGQQLSAFQTVNRNYTTRTAQVRSLAPLVKFTPIVPLLPHQLHPHIYPLPQISGIVFNGQQNLNYHHNTAVQASQNNPLSKTANNPSKQYENYVGQITSMLGKQCQISTLSTSTPPPPLPRQQIRTVKFATGTDSNRKTPSESKEKHPKNENKDVIVENENKHVIVKSENKIIAVDETHKANSKPIKLSKNVEDMRICMPKLCKALNRMEEYSESDINENKHVIVKSENKIITVDETPKANSKPIKLSKNVEDMRICMPKLCKALNRIEEYSESDIKENSAEINISLKPFECKTPKKYFEDSIDILEDTDEAVPSFAVKNNVFRLDFPDYTVAYGSKIKPYKIDDDITVGSLIGIFVSEIHDPFKFWFHIHKDNHELDCLMHQIERYYSILDVNDLRIPITCLTPGQVCAACYNGLWHRAEIVAPPVSSTIKVSFMDYGTVTEVEIENIKFLAAYFSQLPAQSLRGSLSHIKPRTLHWSHEATTCYLNLAAEMMLYAQITEINREENIVYMILCNTNGNEVVQINKTLVDKRYAFYDEEWKIEKINKNNGKRKHHPREDFPTFSMIEAGEYPSFKELVNLHKRGIDYEAFHDIIIYNQSTILNKHENVPESIRNLPYFLTTSNPFRSDILLEMCATKSKYI